MHRVNQRFDGTRLRSMPPVIHEDRARAESFGAVAARYDRARPSYPAELVDYLMESAPERVLDVGTGTGIAARLFTARGCSVVGVEPDSRMAAVARGHGVDVDVSSFEAWSVRQAPFDLVVSGQAWHWVAPRLGPPKVAAVLRAGGRFAAFWNEYRQEAAVSKALDAVYKRYAPGLRKRGLVLGAIQRARPAEAARAKALRVYGGLVDIQWHSFGWDRRYSSESWVDEVSTHSDHLALPASVLRALLEALHARIDAMGGSFVVHCETRLLSASRPR
jgi:SAM-dependent methyltransferase